MGITSGSINRYSNTNIGSSGDHGTNNNSSHTNNHGKGSGHLGISNTNTHLIDSQC